MANLITLYDIGTSDPNRLWCPNVWKTRYSLNYKGIPYRTEWYEYPEIETTCKRIGAEPTTQRPDGSWLYTFPVIHDPSTGRVISDSEKIAHYLDTQYPDTPKLFPPVSPALQTEFLATYRMALPAMWQFIIPATRNLLNEGSIEYWDRTKYGDEVPRQLSDEQKRSGWMRLEVDFGKLDAWCEEKGVRDSSLLLGDKVSFPDLALAGYLIWLRTVWGTESKEWSEFAKWHGGRWGRLLEQLGPYEQSQVKSV